MSASNVPYDANEFTGKRILVTGGSKGIGEAIVNRLLRGGATVLATARTIPAGASAEKFIQAEVTLGWGWRCGALVVPSSPELRAGLSSDSVSW